MPIKYASNFTPGDNLSADVVNNVIDSIKENEDNIKKSVDVSTLDDYVKNTDYATTSKAGVVKIKDDSGIEVVSGDYLKVVAATNVDISNRKQNCFITPMQANDVVKAALLDDNKITGLTEEEKETARNVFDADIKTTRKILSVPSITVNIPEDSNCILMSNQPAIAALTLTMADGATVPVGWECGVQFKSTGAPIVNGATTKVKFIGADCDDTGVFDPVANKGYDISIKNLSSDEATPILIARVGAF